jgi:hypothetical protein
MAEGTGRPEAENGEGKSVGAGLKREISDALVVLDPVTQKLPSEDEVFDEVRKQSAYVRESMNWRTPVELDEALRAEIGRMREGLVAKHEAANGVFGTPTRKTPPSPNPYRQ